MNLYLAAHEITHAFDEVGIMYNSEGFYQPLYDNSTIEAFHNASNCIRKQYSDFSIGGVHVDGNVTLGENIADHGGLKIAEVAYDSWLKRNGNTDATLPAMDGFSPFQLFYLGYALPWCAVHTDSMLKDHVMKDEHAPDKFRVLGPLSNSQRFAESWGCPVGTTMNPVDKCQIWGE
jgi:membrane metallo-endopeptidase-like protein 1